MTRFDFTLRQIAEVVASAGIAALLTMGYIIYVGRVVGPAEYADFAASLSIIYFASLALSPLSPAVARLSARFVARGDHQSVSALRRQAIVRIAGFAVVIAIVGAALSPLVARALNFRSSIPLLLVFAVVLVFAVLNVDRGVVQGLLTFRVHNINTVLEAAARWGFALLFFLRWRSAGGGMASYLAAMIVAELALAIPFHREWVNSDAPVDWREVKRVTVPLAVLMIAVAAMQNIDMLVVKRFFAPADSGAYGAATALARSIGIVFVPLYVMLNPILAGLHESGRRIYRATMRFAALFLALAVVPLIVMGVWPELVVTVLFGQAFVSAGSLLAPLAGIAILLYTGLMLSQALITLEEHRFLAGYAVLTMIEIAALWLFHATFRDVFIVLYAIQGATLLLVVAFFFASAHKHTAEKPIQNALREG